MGMFKEKNREGVKEMRETSKETTDLGTTMTEQASEINELLESIDLQDTEDIQAKDNAESSYDTSFDSAFSEEVESAGEMVKEQGEQISDVSGEELENVNAGIRNLERAEGVTDIGRHDAETAQSKLEGSAGEYEDIISDAEDTASDVEQKVTALKSRLSSIFG